MDAAKVCTQLIGWLEAQLQQSGARGFVVGLSGGLDSAVTAALAQRAAPGHVLGLVMPCHSDPADQAHAVQVAHQLGIEYQVIDLGPVYDALVERFQATLPPGVDPDRLRVVQANIKPRLRMLTLYHAAGLRGYLVLGTDNRAEVYTGYFTKYGDGGADLLPLADLVKGEVRALGRYLGLPEAILQRTPSAGLWADQSDEAEMGLSYEALDRYLLTGEGDPEVVARIEALHRATEHKRRLPPWPVVAR
ncbi:MAG: NAD(+) synthase [Firmicutes bacterium]|nr:NAD(+) synthase [Bacillota bacterium]